MRRLIVDRRNRRAQRQIARKEGSKPTRQQKTIPRRQAHRLGNTFHGQPALARDDGLAFDAFMPWEFNREISTQIKATGPVSTRFQQQEHI